MARRSDHTRDELKALIIEESWEIIKQHGFEGLTARCIAKNIGYAPGTIYNLFSSMDDLYLQLNSKTLDLLLATLSDPACNDPKKTPIKNMKAMAARYMDFAKEQRPYWLMLFNFQVTENRTNSDWYQHKVDQLFILLEGLLEPYFTAKQGQKRKIAARVLWASVHGLCFLQETDKITIVHEPKSAFHMIEYLIDTFVSGIEN